MCVSERKKIRLLTPSYISYHQLQKIHMYLLIDVIIEIFNDSNEASNINCTTTYCTNKSQVQKIRDVPETKLWDFIHLKISGRPYICY